LSRRAIPALEAVVLDEQALHRMKVAVFGEPLGRDDLRPIVRHGEGEATVYAPAIV
jgi:hypothetical protein